MTSIRLELPSQIIDELDLPYEGLRGGSVVTVAIEGLSIAANLATIATLATLQPQAAAFVAAIRRWRLKDSRQSVILTVKGPGLDLKLDLPRNVSSSQLLEQLRPLLDD